MGMTGKTRESAPCTLTFGRVDASPEFRIPVGTKEHLTPEPLFPDLISEKMTSSRCSEMLPMTERRYDRTNYKA